MNNIIAFAGIALLLFSCSNNVEKPKSPTATDSKAIEEHTDFTLELSNYTALHNSPYVLIPTRILNEDEKESSYSGRSYEDRIISWNILFYNTQTGEKYLLDESRKMAISSFKQGYKEDETDSAVAMDKIFYEIRTDDVNGKDNLNSEDPEYLFVSTLPGKNLKQISPSGYHLQSWIVTNQGTTILMRVAKDSNNDGNYNIDDVETIFSYNFGKDTLPKPLLTKKDEEQIKASYRKLWQSN